MTLAQRHRELIEIGDKLFSDRQVLDGLFQELAENFYPERADFTTQNAGAEFASGLDTSVPILVRRDLGDALGAIMRPANTEWFGIGIKRSETLDDMGRRWLAMARRVMWRAIYDKESQFVRTTKEGDHDFATFGQCVLSSEMALSPVAGPVLLHRCWHIRDTVWKDDSYGRIGHVQRNWKLGAAEMVRLFPKTVSDKVRKIAEKDPFCEINCRHAVVMADQYEFQTKLPYVSVYFDIDNKTVLEERGIKVPHYIIPRWKTVAGSQYAFSPAAVAGLPDARLIQAMTYTLLAAGEFAVNPPLVGVSEAIRGAIEAFPGGFTAVDASYDERLGEVLRPLSKGGERTLPINLDLVKDIRQQLSEAFFLSKLTMPPAGEGGMSPFEVQQRVAEFVRKALPLFEPVETEYNGALMEQNFTLLMNAGAFGPKEGIPESLMGQDTEFHFQSPLRQSIEQMKGQKYAAAIQIIAQGAQMDPTLVQRFNFATAQKEAMHGEGIPPEWLKTDEEVQQALQAQQQAQATQGMMAAAGPVLEGVAKVAGAVKPEPQNAAA